MELNKQDSDCFILEPNISVVSIADTAEDLEDGELDTTTNVSSIFEVQFRQKSDFQNLGHTILNALREALNSEEENYSFSISEETTNGIKIRAFVNSSSENIVELENGLELNTTQLKLHTTPKMSSPPSKASTPDYSEELSALFMVDTEPTGKLNTVQVPSYKRSIKATLETVERKKPKEDKNKCERPRASLSCFNCGSSEHGIRDCTKPRNLNRINRAKKAFGTKQERYHVDIEQRFAHLRPGVITDNLKSALGLHRGELPFFFYRMRVLGYPPGWLEDAKVSHSGISLFNSDGAAVLKSDDDEGEVDCINHKYDVNKIIDYPGYNIDPGDKFFDDYSHQNVPPMLENHMKSEFIKSLGSHVIKGYKRRKLKDLPNPASASEVTEPNTTTLEVADMEIENAEIPEENVIFTRPPPPAEPKGKEEKPPPPPPLSATVSTVPAERSASPSLADLEAEQIKLLSELQQSNISTVSSVDDSLIDDLIALDAIDDETYKNSNSLEQQKQTETPTTPLTTNFIKESHMGTPVLQFSPFDHLPSGNNFSVGVCDVINFENLPDSTGKYEQMKGVIKKVRNIITKLHSEDY